MLVLFSHPDKQQLQADMYSRVLYDELVFPDDRPLDQDTKSLLRGVSVWFRRVGAPEG